MTARKKFGIGIPGKKRSSTSSSAVAAAAASASSVSTHSNISSPPPGERQDVRKAATATPTTARHGSLPLENAGSLSPKPPPRRVDSDTRSAAVSASSSMPTPDKHRSHRSGANVGNVANSAGAARLQKILSQPTQSRVSYVPDDSHRKPPGSLTPPRTDQASFLPAAQQGLLRHVRGPKAAPSREETEPLSVQHPLDADSVAHFICHRILPLCRVDPRSIGGSTNAARRRNALMGMPHSNTAPMLNEPLLSFRVSRFELSGGAAAHPEDEQQQLPTTQHAGGRVVTYAKKKKNIQSNANNQLRYVCFVRSTNRPFFPARNNRLFAKGNVTRIANDDAAGDGHTRPASMEEDEEDYSGDGYDNMYNPDPEEEAGDAAMADVSANVSDNHIIARGVNDQTTMMGDEGHVTSSSAFANKKKTAGSDYAGVTSEEEISSFPHMICLTLYPDGSHVDIWKVLELDKLLAVESVASKTAGSGTVRLMFRTGDIVELDCDILDVGNGELDDTAIRKERFLWSLLQIHAILCTSVVERNLSTLSSGVAAVSATGGGYGATSSSGATALPPLIMRNVDRAELQYVSTVNGFLRQNPLLVALLERQRDGHFKETRNSADGADGLGGDQKRSGIDEMDDMAYDMMMGNFGRLILFVNDEEKKDAEEILNSTSWLKPDNAGEPGDVTTMSIDATSTAETFAQLLQKRMLNLEAETCRRLIAWEDEKHFSLTGTMPHKRDTMDALSLANLFTTLDDLDTELQNMEHWLTEKAAAIKPLTDDCRDIEEENRQLEQQWKSYDMLGAELRRLLSGLDVPRDLERVLANPGSAMVYHNNGNVDVDASEGGVEDINRAGRALKDAFEKVEQEGGVHLRAVSERVEGLASMANVFCTSLAQIVVTVMEQLEVEVVRKSDFKQEAKGDSNTTIAKKIRDTQRGFQSSLLAYIKLIEVLALLKPSLLSAIRDAYSELVAEGILSKKRMKVYFQSLPGKSTINIVSVTNDLKDYNAVALKSAGVLETGTANMKPVQAQDIEATLAEMLPVIAREAYFTAALFGLSSRHMDGREKKRNFESAKKSVDHSSQYFRYYTSRICGIASDADADGKQVKGDPMLSLVSSVHLNEAMEGYIDRQKKGGDHSLSLAYVRATILELRKKVDKQWVTWVEEQIKWIKSNPGVPPTGKRAGVFTSFARFPSYLDHVMICCKSGRPRDSSTNLAKIKVVAYYLQKMAGALFLSLQECSERETTDQQYASNVMRMENSYFFTQSIKQRGPDLTYLFQKQIAAAGAICKQSTDAYLGWMIKREFKALHSLFSNVSRIRRDVGDGDVPIHVPRATFVKTLQKESNRDVMKERIGTIYSRMEKHLSEACGLLPVAWKALVKVLYEWFGRWEKLSTQCYNHVLEPSAVDVVRIAKAAGGAAPRRGGMAAERAEEVSPSLQQRQEK